MALVSRYFLIELFFFLQLSAARMYISENKLVLYMSLPQYKIWHDRANCIACGACAAVSNNWEMDPEDGLASCKKRAISNNELSENEEAAMVCPVNIIHVIEGDAVPPYFTDKGITQQPSGKRDD